MVFQHSDEDIELAHALATISHYLDPSRKQSGWLMAASWDRMLMRKIQPQWYGTQYQGSDNGTFLFPVVAGAVTDVEREAMGVPTLAQARGRVPEMAKMMGQRPLLQAPDIEELQEKAKLEADALKQEPASNSLEN